MTDAEIKEIAIKHKARLYHHYTTIEFPSITELSAFAKELIAITRDKVLAELVKDNPPVAIAECKVIHGNACQFLNRTQHGYRVLVDGMPLYAMPTIPEGWQPIEIAPDNTLLVVGWHDFEDEENSARYDFDYKEDGVWVKHDELYQEFCSVAPPGSRGPKETAPYTQYIRLAEPKKG